MKAAWYEKTGSAADVIRIGERATPTPGPGEVLVRIHASGVNPSDVKARAGARGPLAFEFVIPHSDGAGVIEVTGDGVAASRVGERVWIWNAAWRRQFGTCAEYVCVPVAQAVALPDNTDFGAGACLGIPASTASYGVFADGPVEGKTVLVTGGAGAVGHYAIQFAKWGGARVITTVSGPEKAAHARAAGADVVINYKDCDVVEAILDAARGRKVDRIVEVEFGGNLAVSNKVLANGGVIATYGSMAAPTPTLPFYEMMFNGVTLRMFLVYLLAGEERAMVIHTIERALNDGAVRHAITERYSLAETAKAHLAVESGSVVGNVVVTV